MRINEEARDEDGRERCRERKEDVKEETRVREDIRKRERGVSQSSTALRGETGKKKRWMGRSRKKRG